MAYAQITVTTSPTLIVAANNSRRQLIVDNLSASTVYIGPNSAISSSNTVRLLSGSSLEIDGAWFLSAIYGVVSSGTAVVGYWEHP